MLIKDGKREHCSSLQQYYNFRQFSRLSDALGEHPDMVFITNPSSKHLKVALESAQYGCNLFIEKPLSHNLDGIDLLKKKVESKKLTTMVGYQTRFHPCYKLVKNILSENKYGGIVSAGFEWGTYLPYHHPYEDYRQSYAAKRKLGGGVVLGLIHEIDIICSFWGQPEELSAMGGKFSALEMDAEDTVSAHMTFKDGNRKFPVSLFLSYAQTKEIRKFKIQLDRATVFCDLLENTIDVFDEKGQSVKRKSYPRLKKNDLFLEEIDEFISAVREKRKPLVSLDDGIESLNLAIKIKEAIIE
jgi:predicted dehydrogenase